VIIYGESLQTCNLFEQQFRTATQVVENKGQKNVDTHVAICYNSCMSKATKVRQLHYTGLGKEDIGIDEPSWPTCEEQRSWTALQKTRALGLAFNWYNFTQESKRSAEFVAEWLDRMPKRKQLAQIMRKHGDLSPTFGWLCRAATMGYCMQMKDLRKLHAAITRCVAVNLATQANQQAQSVVKAKVTVQDRVNEKLRECNGEVAGALDDFIAAGCEGEPNLMKLMIQFNVPQARVKDIAAALERQYTELKTVKAGTDAQLNEGYSQFGKRQLNRMLDWLKTAQEQVWSYGTLKASNRKPAVRKSRTPQKMVSKVKYLTKSAELKIESIDPVDILKATELWVYDVKKRKLGVYLIDDSQSALYVKGSRILEYSETRSVTKTLRKPEQQLKELMAAGKPASKKWFADLKSVESKLSGRLSDTVLLLKAYK
jgi:hypothetical protein